MQASSGEHILAVIPPGAAMLFNEPLQTRKELPLVEGLVQTGADLNFSKGPKANAVDRRANLGP